MYQIRLSQVSHLIKKLIMTTSAAERENSSLPASLWLTALAIKRPVTTVMIMISLFVAGIVASRFLPQESWPAVNVPAAFVNVPYNGATPAEVERLITKPIEEALATLEGITEMTSRSSANASRIQLQMKLSTELDNKILEVREKVDMVRHLLPEDVERVYVRKFSTEDLPIISLVLSSDQDLSLAYDFLDKNLKQPIERIKGVGSSDFLGMVKPAIEMILDSTKVAMNRVDQDLLLQNLRSANFLVKSGTVLSGQRKYLVTPKGEYQSLKDIENFYVKSGVKLKDIAKIALVSAAKNSQLRTDRKKSVGLEIFKESDANLVEVAAKIVSVIEQIKNQPAFSKVKIDIEENSSEEIQESLADLFIAGGLGMLMSFMVLFVFLRNSVITLIVVVSVPISLSFALAGMYALGYSINMLSLAGLFIAIGLLIDNSVVICESILQQQKTSVAPITKIYKGVNNVSTAIISGTLTTAIVFLPLLLGEKNFITVLIDHIAVAICLPLFASLIIAKTLIPLMLSRVKQNALSAVVIQGKLNTNYAKYLKKILTMPKATAGIIFLLCLSGVLARGLVNDNQDSGNTETEIIINYQIKGEQRLKDLSKVVDQMEQYLYANQQQFEFSQINSRIGDSFAMSRIKLNDNISVAIFELKNKIRQNFPEYAIAKPSFEWSPEKERLVKMTLSGRSTERLIDLSQTVIAQLNNVNGFAEVGIDNGTNKSELLLRINRQQVSRLGLSTREVANRIAMALRGTNLRSFRDQKSGETAIRLVYHSGNSVPLAQLKQLSILDYQGKTITLQQLVTITTAPVMQQISRVQRRTNLTISINLEDINRKEASEKINQVMDYITLPSGYTWQLGSQFKRDQQAMNDMVINMMLALALIFMVMAALFESLLMPIAILSSIGLAFIGVYWSFAILGIGLGDTGMIGMLILMGIVVNNGIVLIDQINQRKGQAEHLLVPIIDACVSRIRPILMTVATTVIGMLPLAFASTDNQTYPIAVAIIGGLFFSTFTSLFLVPYCYLMLVKLGERTSKRFAIAKRFADRLIKT